MKRLPALVLAVVAASCGTKRGPATPVEPFPAQQIIGELQEFEQGLGLARTGNFQRYADTPQARFRCYFAGKLELPGSYERLRLVESAEPRCAIDQEIYDVFLYAVEAVATGTSPVSPALAEARLERMLVVVPHEDFHDQRETRRAAPEIAEAGATLIGFLTASEFARATYGPDSEIFQRLQGEAGRFLEKAKIVNAFYTRLAALYATFESGRIGRERALSDKAKLFADLQRACASPAVAPVSFNPCPVVMNNAGLAFDRTYTRHYPRLFELHRSLTGDTKASIAALKRIMATGPRTEDDLVEEQRALTP